jgi:hypothetical protein
MFLLFVQFLISDINSDSAPSGSYKSASPASLPAPSPCTTRRGPPLSLLTPPPPPPSPSFSTQTPYTYQSPAREGMGPGRTSFSLLLPVRAFFCLSPSRSLISLKNTETILTQQNQTTCLRPRSLEVRCSNLRPWGCGLLLYLLHREHDLECPGRRWQSSHLEGS